MKSSALQTNLPCTVFLQHHRYSWPSDARHHGNEPQTAECGVCGVWRGWSVSTRLLRVTRNVFIAYIIVFCCKLRFVLWFFSTDSLKWVSPTNCRRSSDDSPKLGRRFCSPPRCPNCLWNLRELVRALTLSELAKPPPPKKQGFNQHIISISIFSSTGLTDPVLIRLDVDSKLSEQLKVNWNKCLHFSLCISCFGIL